jgi:hypothetical protein
MSNLAIRELEHIAVLNSAEMQSIKGGALFVNLFDVYAHPENYSDGIVKVAKDYIEGN